MRGLAGAGRAVQSLEAGLKEQLPPSLLATPPTQGPLGQASGEKELALAWSQEAGWSGENGWPPQPHSLPFLVLCKPGAEVISKLPHQLKTPRAPLSVGPIINSDVQTSSSSIFLLYNIPRLGYITQHSLYCCITLPCKGISHIIHSFSSQCLSMD